MTSYYGAQCFPRRKMRRINKTLNVGRPKKIVAESFIAACLAHRNEIITTCNTVVSKNAPIWGTIREELNLEVQPQTLYTKVTSNFDGVLNLLRGNSEVNEESMDVVDNETDISNTSEENSDQNSYTEDIDVQFQTILTREEFRKITKISTYKQGKKNGGSKTRSWTTFIPYTWQSIMQHQIYNTMRKMDVRINCALHFRKHHLAANAEFGSIDGRC